MMRKRFFALLAMTAISVAASPALADYLDIFLSVGDQRSDPSDPTVGEDGVTVTWPPEWEEITLPYTLDPPLEPGESIFLGLENLYDKDMRKEVTLKYEGLAEVLPIHTRAGYPEDDPGIWNEFHPFYNLFTHLHKVEGIIGPPQPSWEWIKLTNTSDHQNRGVRIIEYTSKCDVPEPATLVLLAFGGMVMMRRSRR